MTSFKGYSVLFVDHLNMDKQDNRLVNLEYVTQKENSKRAYRVLGKEVFDKKSIPIEWNGKIYNSGKELSLLFGMNRNAVGDSIRNNRPFKGHYAKLIRL